MILISHRGNFESKNVKTENSPSQIDYVLSKNIQVEIDVRYNDGEWYLGHDYGEHIVSKQYLMDRKEMLWFHAKNISALQEMLELGLHCFWHQEDDYTLTSKGIIWAYPNKYTKKGILVMPKDDFIEKYKSSIYGICVDNVRDYL
jgi:hypothetical protein